MEKKHLKLATCPLCMTAAEIARHTDWNRYDCPTCGAFEISGLEEAECLVNPTAARARREHIGRERRHGITIPRIGLNRPPT
jgi:ribosomal protein S27AE